MAGTDPRERRSTGTEQPDRGRRAGDGPEGPDSATAQAEGRGSRALRRFRQPLIGLGLAGMAIPMVQATNAAEEGEPEKEEAQGDAEAESYSATTDTEDQLVERIAETREDAARREQVEQAVDRYGIDEALAEDIYDIARETNIEPRLAYGLVKTESTFNERAVSPVGARGLTQVMPRTAAWLVPGTKTQDLYDRQTNLRLGFTYLDQMITKYKGNVRLALLAYNRGPGTVDKVLKKGGNPDNGYADKVLRG
jgi:soluble lytic murein transglycosylase-like protein